MSALLDGKVALVTGGSSGMGRAISLAFAEHGIAGLVVADVRREPREGGDPTDQLLRDAGVSAVFVETDVSNADSVRSAVAAAEQLGGLDVMVNNAGVYKRQAVFDVTEEDLDRIYAVNVKGTFFGCQKAAEVMRGRGGVIINLSSVASHRGSANHSPYSASKGAVRSLTYALARELAPLGIRVNAIHPGAVDTEMVRSDGPEILSAANVAALPMGPAKPEDIARAAVFLASDLSGHVSGSSLTVDGAAGSMG